MSLQLSLEQTNDAKILYLTDTSTWDDVDTLPFNWADVASGGTATLTVTYNTTDNKDFANPDPDPALVINIIAVFQAASAQSDLVFEIDSADLELGSDTEILDGIWKFQYDVSDGGDTSQLIIDVNLDQNIQNGLYQRFASIPLIQFCNCKNMTENLDDLIVALGIQWSTEVASSVARKSNILDIQEMLKRLIQNYPYGTNIK